MSWRNLSQYVKNGAIARGKQAMEDSGESEWEG